MTTLATHDHHAGRSPRPARAASRSSAAVSGGVGAAVMLRRAGYEDVTVFERGERLGGVWHWNTYPGAACDVPSHLYEFSFAPNPRWSHRFAPQAEIQAYVEDVAARYGVLDRIRTGTEVESGRWDESRCRWVLETSSGTHEADVLIAAQGAFKAPSVPPITGLASFAGPAFHTAGWRTRRRAGRQARGGRRDRLQRDPVRAGDPTAGRAPRHLPAHPRLDDPEDGLRV